MEVASVETLVYYYIVTKDGDEYRRNCNYPYWEKRYNDSWEFLYGDAELEIAFQDYMRNENK